MKAVSPSGAAIVGAMELIPCVASLDETSFRRDADGRLAFDYAGESKLDWDDQHARLVDGQRLFIDADNIVWREDQLTVTGQ